MRALIRLVFVNLLGNLLRLLAFPLRRRRPRWVRISLVEPLPARPAHSRWLRRKPSLAALSAFCKELAKDPGVEGVLFDLHEVSGGWAHAQSLRGLLVGLSRAGKKVVAHLSSPTPREYFVATGAGHIVMDESGPLALVGLHAEAMFYGRALGRVGIKAETEFRGEYKSMGEMLTREDMSAAHREALDAILDGVHETLVVAIAAARGIDRARAAELVVGGPYLAADAERVNLVDKVAYADEVAAWAGAPRRVPSPRDYVRARRLRFAWRPVRRRPAIAVVPLHGIIVAGEGTGGRSLGARAAARTLRAVRESRRVAAVVLHIDSRGGSAAGSDLIWREIALLRARKPTVAYLHDVAASGGYYIACAATRIVAQPATLTGSIGVVAGKVSFGGLLEQLGVTGVILSRGEAAAMHSPLRAFSDEERRRLAAEVDGMYRQFVHKVAAGRKLDEAEAEQHARGRVWLGGAARERRLVDELGDADAAVRAARRLAGPATVRYDIVDAAVVPRRRSLLSRLVAVEPLLEETLLLMGERTLAVAPLINVA